MKKYPLPSFLSEFKLTEQQYERWLARKASSLALRDRERFKDNSINKETYKVNIHNSVERSKGFDEYTGEKLEWGLISTYNNVDSIESGIEYKKKFHLLPTVDHVAQNGLGEFRICSWRTNDCKNDLSLTELIAFCKKIIENNAR